MTNARSNSLESIHHIGVQVSDIDAALAWYRERFAFEAVYVDASWALLQFENVALALALPGQHPAHFAGARDDAETHGELTPHRDGTASVYICDPWVNVIEIMKPATGD